MVVQMVYLNIFKYLWLERCIHIPHYLIFIYWLMLYITRDIDLTLFNVRKCNIYLIYKNKVFLIMHVLIIVLMYVNRIHYVIL